VKIKNTAELANVLEDFAAPIAVRTRAGDLYLLVENEDGDVWFIGIPFAEDEYGRKVNQNRFKLPDLLAIQWPLELLSNYGPSEDSYRRRREARAVAGRRQPYPNE
jgi:hypothetical protein